jgi:hypothetical protein
LYAAPTGRGSVSRGLRAEYSASHGGAGASPAIYVGPRTDTWRSATASGSTGCCDETRVDRYRTALRGKEQPRPSQLLMDHALEQGSWRKLAVVPLEILSFPPAARTTFRCSARMRASLCEHDPSVILDPYARAEGPPALAPVAVQGVLTARTRGEELAVDLDANETVGGREDDLRASRRRPVFVDASASKGLHGFVPGAVAGAIPPRHQAASGRNLRS